jgi:hypothetical protein
MDVLGSSVPVLHVAEKGAVVGSLAGEEGFENNAEIIWSATAQELLDANNNPNFYHRSEHLADTKAVGAPELVRAYASTLEYRVKSEHFSKNHTYYRVWILLKDFKIVARDKKISIEDSVDYVLHYGDVHVRCSCPSFLYHGFAYQGDQLGYLYGLPREKRFPKVRNPTLQNVSCKHIHMTLEQMLKDNEKIIKMFSEYYKRLPSVPQNQMIAIPAPKADQVTETPEVEEFQETGDIEVTLDKKETQVEVEPEVISEEDPSDPDTVVVDTKLSEEKLPEDQRYRYASDGEEDEEGGDLDGQVPLGDTIGEEEVGRLAEEIEDAGAPKNDNEKFSTEWAFQRFRRIS